MKKFLFLITITCCLFATTYAGRYLSKNNHPKDGYDQLIDENEVDIYDNSSFGALAEETIVQILSNLELNSFFRIMRTNQRLMKLGSKNLLAWLVTNNHLGDLHIRLNDDESYTISHDLIIHALHNAVTWSHYKIVKLLLTNSNFTTLITLDDLKLLAIVYENVPRLTENDTEIKKLISSHIKQKKAAAPQRKRSLRNLMQSMTISEH